MEARLTADKEDKKNDFIVLLGEYPSLIRTGADLEGFRLSKTPVSRNAML